MRINRLVIEGFGPFRHRQTIDFDEVAAAGIFLIGGDTGSGKSTILDAVSYALFGSVPRYSTDVKRVRSDYCDLSDRTEVGLEFSVSDGRFRVIRSPEYDRLAQRRKVEATTKQKAAAEFARWHAGEWVVVATKDKEVAEHVHQVLGLNQLQFQQVILLAQGKFMAFLQARSQERREVLSTIFGTSRFEAVRELIHEWEVQQERELSHRLGQIRDRANQVVELLDQFNGLEVEVPDAVTTGWLDRVAQSVKPVVTTVETRYQVAKTEAQIAHQAWLAAKDTHELQQRREVARRRLAELLAQADKQDERVRALDTGKNLNELAALVQNHQTAQARQGAHEEEIEQLWQQLRQFSVATDADVADLETGPAEATVATSLPRPVDPTDAITMLESTVAIQERQRLLGELTDAVEIEADLVEQIGALEQRAKDLADLEDACVDIENQIADLPGRQVAVATALAEAKAATGQVMELNAELSAKRKMWAAAVQQARLLSKRDQIAARLRQAAQAEDQAAQTHAAALARFRSELAAVLANELADGQPCVVCGSREHPDPAPVADGLPTADEVDSLAELLSVARDKRQDLVVQLADVERELAVAEVVSQNRSVAELNQETDDLARSLVQAEELAGQEAGWQSEHDNLQQASAELSAKRLQLVQQVATGQAELAATRRQVSASQDVVAQKRGDFATVMARVSRVEDELNLWQQLASAQQRHEQAEIRVAETQRVCEAASLRLNVSLDIDWATVPSAEQLAQLEVDIDNYRQELAVVSAVTDQPDVLAAPEEPVDVAHFEAAYEVAQEQENEELAARERINERITQLDGHLEAGRGLVAAVQSDTEEYAILRGLAETLSGRGSGTKAMDLETFVLAAKLEEIVAAANTRLGTMSEGRYELVHDPSKESNRAKSGLGLAVIDNYTGKARSPESLSGGETFVASLALALGLADVVSQQSGGIQLDTLFVDEGFGSLDPDTLETALTALENLRTNGRCVGLISHVAAMKERLPAAIEVRRLPTNDSAVYAAGGGPMIG